MAKFIRKRKTGAVWESLGGQWIKRSLGHCYSLNTKPVGYIAPFIYLDARFERLNEWSCNG